VTSFALMQKTKQSKLIILLPFFFLGEINLGENESSEVATSTSPPSLAEGSVVAAPEPAPTSVQQRSGDTATASYNNVWDSTPNRRWAAILPATKSSREIWLVLSI
jgi:hypothetical protein